nr:hypothetical protein [Tanacetum cinerariifolium]
MSNLVTLPISHSAWPFMMKLTLVSDRRRSIIRFSLIVASRRPPTYLLIRSSSSGTILYTLAISFRSSLHNMANAALVPIVLLCEFHQVEEGLQDIYDHVIEIPLQRIEDIETAQRQLETGQLIASGERAHLSDRTRGLERENLKVRAFLSIEKDWVDSLHRHMALSHEEFRQNMTITRSGMTPEVIEELINPRVEEALAAYEEASAANA